MSRDAVLIVVAVTGAGAVSTLLMLLAADEWERVGEWAGRVYRWTARHEAAVGAVLAIVLMTAALGCLALR